MKRKSGYVRRVVVPAPRASVFAAVSTLRGLRGWWTPRVSGSARAGGTLRFEFDGLDENIVMRVDATRAPSRVEWTCIRHTSLPEWNDTQLVFDIDVRSASSCELTFRHVGLTRDLDCFEDCKAGWQHFIRSLASFAVRGRGDPYRA